MIINSQDIFSRTSLIIKELYGDDATFRDGQYEAIEATMRNNRSLVVQKTGWGKSLVYFTCTKIFREQGKGVTIVVSPLLILMENQIEAAKKLGIKCDVLNSLVVDRRSEIIKELLEDNIDLLLVTPETLFKKDIQDSLKDIKIGLFVIDEAHCISDWGHDFRLEYGNLYKVLGQLPANVPVLATTATANDRVVDDLKTQLGNNVYVSRGPLTRESLAIKIMILKNKAERYGWILQNINMLPGSGIIYCLTQRDCDYLADFLIKNGVNAMSYYSRDQSTEHINRLAENLFKGNDIKVLVSTIKLGMGYDKGDIGFVIHFQQPANVVSYYQQIGRAGRNIEHAYAILMSGKEDLDIIDYFINTAFPSELETSGIIEFLEYNNGVKLNQIYSHINLRKNLIDKALMFLSNEGFIYKELYRYYLTSKKFEYNKKHYDEVTALRRKEKEQVQGLLETKVCYSKFIVNCLDDFTATDCNRCENCLNEAILPSSVDIEYLEIALEYINKLVMEIKPRKRWAATSQTSQSEIIYKNSKGICLSKYGDVGYGELVKRDKYSKNPKFCDELVGKSSEILKPIIKMNNIECITCVPSLRSNIVEDFTERLAQNCGIPFVKLLSKKPAKQQKFMQNSSYQCQNALNSFFVNEGAVIPKSIILIDDIVDSRWTLTVCGYKLMEKGCRQVLPFALADSGEKES